MLCTHKSCLVQLSCLSWNCLWGDISCEIYWNAFKVTHSYRENRTNRKPAWGLLRLIEMQNTFQTVSSVMCVSSPFPTHSAFIMYRVCSVPLLPPRLSISIFTHSVFLSTDSAFPGILDSQTCSGTHICTGSSLAENHKPCLFFPVNIAPHVLFF